MKIYGSDCDGVCNRPDNVRCSGPVRRVRVWNGSQEWGTFDYCNVACAEDRRNGLTVTLEENTAAPTAGSETP